MAITGVNHVTLAVTDLPRSVWFYSEILGGTLKADWSRGAYVELGNLWLCLSLTEQQIVARNDDTHLAFSCADGDFASLASHIHDHAELWRDNSSEGASLYFLDPDGHKLELHQGNLETRLAHYRAHPEKAVRLHD